MRNVSAVACLLLLFAYRTEAQSVRTFVATHGVDTNPCSRTEPCRSLGVAVAAVAAGGEVIVLDSGGYGPVTINTAISIIAPPSVHAAIAPTSGEAVIVSADPSDRVVIRNLYLNAHGAFHGVQVFSARSVHLESLVVNGFIAGISMFPTAAADLFIADTVVRNSSGNGIELIGAEGEILNASMVRGRVEGSGNIGILVGDRANLAAIDSVAAGNGIGFQAHGAARLVLERCSVTGNTTGLYTMTATLFDVSASTIAFNGTGLAWIGPSGTIYSRGNNTLRGNGTNGAFTAVFAAQ